MRNGTVTTLRALGQSFHGFLEYKDRMVLLSDSQIVAVVSKDKDLFRSESSFIDTNSVFLDGHKVYFLDSKMNIVEIDVEALSEKVVMKNAGGPFSAAPNSKNFMILQLPGVLIHYDRKLVLKEVFPKMKECSWIAIHILNHYAVIAGFSDYSLKTGQKMPKERNFILLIKLSKFEVVNVENPIELESTLVTEIPREEGSSTV